MELKVNVQKKAFRTEKGEERTYYSLTAEIGGEVIRLKPDDKEKKLFNYLLDKLDIPVEAEDDKNALMQKLLNGEVLSDSEKAKLRAYLDEEE